MPDAFIIEGPLAGGHLGFSLEQLNNPTEYNLEKILVDTLKIIEPFEQEIGKKIPLIVAGGIYTYWHRYCTLSFPRSFWCPAGYTFCSYS